MTNLVEMKLPSFSASVFSRQVGSPTESEGQTRERGEIIHRVSGFRMRVHVRTNCDVIQHSDSPHCYTALCIPLPVYNICMHVSDDDIQQRLPELS